MQKCNLLLLPMPQTYGHCAHSYRASKEARLRTAALLWEHRTVRARNKEVVAQMTPEKNIQVLSIANTNQKENKERNSQCSSTYLLSKGYYYRKVYSMPTYLSAWFTANPFCNVVTTKWGQRRQQETHACFDVRRVGHPHKEYVIFCVIGIG